MESHSQLLQHISLSPDSKVWVYQSDRALADEEVTAVQNELNQFVQQWTSHNNELSAAGIVLHKRFLILMVDESIAGASGCSIDKSVHFMKQIESRFQLNLFDRLRIAYITDDTIHFAHKDDFAGLFEAGTINDDTLIFNNLVGDRRALETEWLTPLSKSWVKQMM